MSYVPKHQRTTAWYLFNRLFKVRVNALQVRSVEEIQAFGTPTTGNEDYDRELAKCETVVMISIAQMEDMYNNGYPVKIVDRDDTKIIYELITNHLEFMRNMLVGSENVTGDEQTMNELIRLDAFANDMFHHARFKMRDGVSSGGIAAKLMSNRFAGLTKLGRQRQLPTKPLISAGRDYSTGADVPEQIPVGEPVEPEVVDDPRLPKRISLARLFENQKRTGLNWRGNGD